MTIEIIVFFISNRKILYCTLTIINQYELPTDTQAKYQGLYFDDDLTWIHSTYKYVFSILSLPLVLLIRFRILKMLIGQLKLFLQNQELHIWVALHFGVWRPEMLLSIFTDLNCHQYKQAQRYTQQRLDRDIEHIFTD